MYVRMFITLHHLHILLFQEQKLFGFFALLSDLYLMATPFLPSFPLELFFEKKCISGLFTIDFFPP